MNVDPSTTSQRMDQSTPNGGDYSIAYWLDNDGNATIKSLAVKAKVVEYKESGKVVFTTHASMRGTGSSS